MKAPEKSALLRINYRPSRPLRFLRKARWFFGTHLGLPRDVSVLTVNGLLTFDSRDRTTGRLLRIYRGHEFQFMTTTVMFLKQQGCLRGGDADTVLDIGGYIGMSTTGFLLHDLFRRSVAFEPDPTNFRLLTHNLRQNGLVDRAEAYNVGLSDAAGTATFERSERNFGDHRVRSAEAGVEGQYDEEDRATIPVELSTLDAMVESGRVRLESVALLWMDTQGHEMHVLRGAREFLRQRPDVPVVMEFWPYALARQGTSAAEFAKVVRQSFSRCLEYAFGRWEARDVSQLEPLFQKHSGPGDSTSLLLMN